MGIEIYTWDPNSGSLYLKTELKHGLLVHQSMCSRLCLIQRLICMSILGVISFQRRLLINLICSKYDPLMDSSAELGPIFLNYYQTRIGVLIWMVELGRIDIITEVSKLASQLELPREGHLEAVFHIFGYLKGQGPSKCPDGIRSNISNS